MRQLVEEQVMVYFRAGYKELGLRYINYKRERLNISVLPFADDAQVKTEEDMRHLILLLSDVELLSVLESQACERYR